MSIYRDLTRPAEDALRALHINTHFPNLLNFMTMDELLKYGSDQRLALLQNRIEDEKEYSTHLFNLAHRLTIRIAKAIIWIGLGGLAVLLLYLRLGGYA